MSCTFIGVLYKVIFCLLTVLLSVDICLAQPRSVVQCRNCGLCLIGHMKASCWELQRRLVWSMRHQLPRYVAACKISCCAWIKHNSNILMLTPDYINQSELIYMVPMQYDVGKSKAEMKPNVRVGHVGLR